MKAECGVLKDAPPVVQVILKVPLDRVDLPGNGVLGDPTRGLVLPCGVILDGRVGLLLQVKDAALILLLSTLHNHEVGGKLSGRHPGKHLQLGSLNYG
jgi:hypothetical protein